MVFALLKQLIRKPRKYALAAVLLGFSAFLLGTGLSLSLVALQTSEEIDGSFKTYGTIEQEPDEYEEIVYYDGRMGREAAFSAPVYRRYIPLEAIGALSGIAEPPIRLATQFAHLFREDGRKVYVREAAQERKYKKRLYRFTVKEDMVLGEKPYDMGRTQPPAYPLQILEVIYGGAFDDSGKALAGSQMDINYMGKEKVPLQAGKEYVGNFNMDYGYDGLAAVEEIISADMFSVETEVLLPGGVFPAEDQALTDRLVSNYALVDDNSFLATPIRSLDELAAFNGMKPQIVDGRDMTAEEIAGGARVCLVPETVVRDPEDTEYPNGIAVGDTIYIEAYAQSYLPPAYYDSAGTGVRISGLFTPGTARREAYTIVGAYAYRPDYTGYAREENIAPEQILIPYTGEADLPVIGGGPYIKRTNSFVLENGGIPSFLQAAAKYGNLTFSFNDSGYTLAAAGAQAVSRVGLVLLLSGVVAFLAVGAFFVRLEVMGGRRETGIRLALGEKKRRALLYLLAPLLAVVMAGTAVGIFTGDRVSEGLARDTYAGAAQFAYDRSYSGSASEEPPEPFTPDFRTSGALYAALWAGVNLFCIAGAALYGRGILREEPHKLLGKGGRQ